MQLRLPFSLADGDAELAVDRWFDAHLAFDIESGKKKAQKIRRPVLFGELGREDLAYEVDGFEPTQGIGLEVPAGVRQRSFPSPAKGVA